MFSHFIRPTEGRVYRLNTFLALRRPWVILVQSNTLQIATITFAGITEANFSGYARVQPVWPDATALVSGDAASLSPGVSFTHDGGPTANTLYGIATVEDDGGFGSHLLSYQRFPVPIVMSVNGDNISRLLRQLEGQYPLS